MVKACNVVVNRYINTKFLKHLNPTLAIGANHPTHKQLHLNLLQEGVIYVDSEKTTLQESGDIIQSKANIYIE